MDEWKKRLTDWRNWAALLLFAVSLYQAKLVFDNYAVIWLKRAWKNSDIPSMERSALYYFGDTGMSFMDFIDSHVPTDMNVIVPGKTTQFASQSILQFYLMPRAIIACPCNQYEQACAVCLQASSAYIPATDKFPPENLLAGTKEFIPFESNSPIYKGIYVPVGQSASNTDVAGNNTPYHPFSALVIDLCVLGSLSFLGFILGRMIVPWLGWVEALSLSVPLGAGLLTWFIFLSSLARIPIVLPSVILIYIVLLAGLLLLRRRLNRQPETAPVKPQIHLHLPDISKINPIEIGAWALAGCVVLAVTFISVNRSYSQFDDIAIWSMKGYGIAHTGTIFDMDYLGGHGLAYPLNLSLSITVFKLASGDVLPGSKFLFPILLAALAFGTFRFWRRWGIHYSLAWSGMMLLLTVPEIFLHSTLGFANLPFASYLVLGVFWSVDGLLHQQPRSLFMGGLLLALAAWTRPEGLVFAGILMVVLFIASVIALRKLYFSVFWVLPLIIPVVWLLFAAKYVAQDQAGNSLSRIAKDLLDGSLSLAPLKMMASFARSTVVTPITWGYIFPIAAVLMIVAIYQWLPRVNPPAFLLIPVAIMAALVPAGLFFVESSTDPNFDIFLTVSFNRAYIPAAFLTVAVGILAFGSLGMKRSKPLTVLDE